MTLCYFLFIFLIVPQEGNLRGWCLLHSFQKSTKRNWRRHSTNVFTIQSTCMSCAMNYPESNSTVYPIQTIVESSRDGFGVLDIGETYECYYQSCSQPVPLEHASAPYQPVCTNLSFFIFNSGNYSADLWGGIFLCIGKMTSFSNSYS